MDVEDTSPKAQMRKLLSWYVPIIQAQAVDEYKAKLTAQETLNRMWKEFNEIAT